MNRSFFSANDSLVDLINRDFNILPILSRFSIPLGFGTKSIGEVCQEAGINTELFLLIVNFILTGKVYGIKTEHAEGLVDFLHKSHDYFMAFKFPIVRFFDDYVKQVKDHFDYEETTVFPYVRSLAEGVAIPGYSISQFTRHHDKISEKLDELKNIILRYYTTSVPDLMYDVLVDLYNCQSDLENHNDIENTILVPVTTTLEMNDAKTKS